MASYNPYAVRNLHSNSYGNYNNSFNTLENINGWGVFEQFGNGGGTGALCCKQQPSNTNFCKVDVGSEWDGRTGVPGSSECYKYTVPSKFIPSVRKDFYCILSSPTAPETPTPLPTTKSPIIGCSSKLPILNNTCQTYLNCNSLDTCSVRAAGDTTYIGAQCSSPPTTNNNSTGDIYSWFGDINNIEGTPQLRPKIVTSDNSNMETIYTNPVIQLLNTNPPPPGAPKYTWHPSFKGKTGSTGDNAFSYTRQEGTNNNYIYSPVCLDGWIADSDGYACADFDCRIANGNVCNNGTCKADGTCTCNPGATGQDCSQCETGYFGETCQACPGGAATPCSNHGTCDGSGTTGGSGTCTCATGFGGIACSSCLNDYYPKSGPDMCSIQCNTSNCVNGTCDTNGNCICNTGWKGTTCEECDTGWTGDSCNNCKSGYFGATCDPCPGLNPETGTVCSGNGVCADGTGGTGLCTCEDSITNGHWEGTACNECKPGFTKSSSCKNCSGNRQYDTDKNACICKNNWYGTDCNVYCTRADTCNNQGSCDVNGTCVCDDGWSGTGCARQCYKKCSACNNSDPSACTKCNIAGNYYGPNNSITPGEETGCAYCPATNTAVDSHGICRGSIGDGVQCTDQAFCLSNVCSTIQSDTRGNNNNYCGGKAPGGDECYVGTDCLSGNCRKEKWLWKCKNSGKCAFSEGDSTGYSC